MLVLKTLNFLAILAALVPASVAVPVKEERQTTVTELQSYDYIVVGSGAGGGPLAARLAINGQKVLLLEAGDDQGETPQQSIPAFYPAASEYAPMSWDFFVRHYPDDAREALNQKATYTTPEGGTYIGLDPPAGSTLKGIWYPRTGTLGGCATHNALITVYPHDKDWSVIQSLTGDSSWAPENMRQYFERVERNTYLTNSTDSTANGHGFDGWLGTDEANLGLIADDSQMLSMVAAANSFEGTNPTANITDAESLATVFPFDLNTAYPNRDSTEGLYRIPLHVSDGRRSSPRNFLLATANALNPDGSKKYHLDIRTHSFVTKVRFERKRGAVPRAVGVDFLDGESLYAADPRNTGNNAGTPGTVNATREVIISAGVFNTPQILKLSGVGPKAELKEFNISVVVDLPGVGTNLQDHYEISTVSKFETDFELLEGCTFLSTGPTDPCYVQYTTNATEQGPYATNLLPSAVLLKSSVASSDRDMFIFGGPVMFRGYFQGYTNAAIADTKHWSWVTLQAHQRNHAGTVTLKSANPLDVPSINFNFFDTGTTAGGADAHDLQPMVEGINWSRKVSESVSGKYSFTEEQPGADITTTEQIRDFIKNQAWGHHASCTAPIGADSDPLAVLDSHFRVRGVKGLRVVDASVFPQIPGFFPVAAVFMIGEKAADVIIADNA
ncbi:GMC oxidoreductase [Cadophora sp. DSE1049]|nr:GMC oxidoreductase [Cadophora sp. DSE1049]